MLRPLLARSHSLAVLHALLATCASPPRWCAAFGSASIAHRRVKARVSVVQAPGSRAPTASRTAFSACLRQRGGCGTLSLGLPACSGAARPPLLRAPSACSCAPPAQCAPRTASPFSVRVVVVACASLRRRLRLHKTRPSPVSPPLAHPWRSQHASILAVPRGSATTLHPHRGRAGKNNQVSTYFWTPARTPAKTE